MPKSIGCSKNFRGPEQLDTREKVETWVKVLCEEVSERLYRDKEDNQRFGTNEGAAKPRGCILCFSPSSPGFDS